jgi:hypothetical protein
MKQDQNIVWHRGPNLGFHTGHPEWRYSSFTSAPPRRSSTQIGHKLHHCMLLLIRHLHVILTTLGNFIHRRGSGQFFSSPQRSDRHWDPSNLLPNAYQRDVSLELKLPGREAVMVVLYINFPIRLDGVKLCTEYLMKTTKLTHRT